MYVCVCMWSAVQNSLECNSHASFQESFKVNKCMSVPIENCDFLSKLLTQVCNVEYHPLTIQTFCHLFMNRNFLCIVMTMFHFCFTFFTLATVATTNHYSKLAPLMKLLIFLTGWTSKRLILQSYTVFRV